MSTPESVHSRCSQGQLAIMQDMAITIFTSYQSCRSEGCNWPCNYLHHFHNLGYCVAGGGGAKISNGKQCFCSNWVVGQAHLNRSSHHAAASRSHSCTRLQSPGWCRSGHTHHCFPHTNQTLCGGGAVNDHHHSVSRSNKSNFV